MGRALQMVAMATIALIVLWISLPLCACSRVVSNDSAAVANLRTINTAEVTFKSMSPSAGAYGSMADLIEAGLLDDTFIDTKAGYKYSISLDAKGSGYTAEAVPAATNTGRFGYYSHPDAVVRYTTLAPAGRAGRPVQ